MEKYIIPWSYRLGIACFAVAILWGVLYAVRISPGYIGYGNVGYMSFYKGGILFLLVTIASANCAWFASQKPPR
jgi:hypothetical protein